MEVVVKPPPKIGINEFLADCGMLYKRRREIYRDAWLYMSPEDIAAGLKLKAARIEALLKADADKEKVKDDLLDITIYSYFLYALIFDENGK